jgi:hypothetical protein
MLASMLLTHAHEMKLPKKTQTNAFKQKNKSFVDCVIEIGNTYIDLSRSMKYCTADQSAE